MEPSVFCMPLSFSDLEPSPLLLFGLLLLAGTAGGELSRRVFNLPRTTGYVLVGVMLGNSGLRWVDPYVLGAAQFFIYPALGLILFELGNRLPAPGEGFDRRLVLTGLAESGGVLAVVGGVLLWAGADPLTAGFGAAVALSTSPAITIATTADVGADGPSTRRLYGLVAINGCVAFTMMCLLRPLMQTDDAGLTVAHVAGAFAELLLSVALGAGLAALACRAAGWLGHHAEHQHLMLLGLIVIGTGLPLSLDVSPLLTLLSFGVLTRLFDRQGRVVALRIASDARVFLVVTFVLAGAALDIGELLMHWPLAVALALARFGGHWGVLHVAGRLDGQAPALALFTAVGLLPMSSVALVLLGDAGLAGSDAPHLAGALMGLIVLMQLLGPLCTQLAIIGFGEARRYQPRRGKRHLPNGARPS